MECVRITCMLMFPLLVVVTLPMEAMGTGTVNDLATCLKNGGLTNITNPRSNFTTYDRLLKFSLQNLRFTEGWVPKPALMILPMSNEEVQAAVKCCVDWGWMMCIRSGGHDFEGTSSWSDVPFVIIDLMNLESVEVDVANRTAWAQAGATIGQLYAAVGNASDELGFSAGDCPTVGLGGHIMGGGFGTYHRKYGLAADLVEDVLLVDAKGRLLNKDTMGEDVFWALRGGGGGSWGVVVAWKLKLVKTPPKFAQCRVSVYGESNVTDTMYKWQTVASEATEDLSLYAGVFPGNATAMYATYYIAYFGSVEKTVELMESIFPEIGLTSDSCWLTSWVDSFSDTNVTDLSDRSFNKSFFKHKSDFLTKPIPKYGLRGLWKVLNEHDGSVAFAPFGGVLNNISANFTPFPYRKGYIANLMYGRYWTSPAGDLEYIEYVNTIYDYMTAFVAPDRPRASYINSLDLDLGYAFNGTATVEEGMEWGLKYFQDNYYRLVKAKTEIDPTNVFRYGQSIPPATSLEELNSRSSSFASI